METKNVITLLGMSIACFSPVNAASLQLYELLNHTTDWVTIYIKNDGYNGCNNIAYRLEPRSKIEIAWGSFTLADEEDDTNHQAIIEAIKENGQKFTQQYITKFENKWPKIFITSTPYHDEFYSENKVFRESALQGKAWASINIGIDNKIFFSNESYRLPNTPL
jgi:hypothetical protein